LADRGGVGLAFVGLEAGVATRIVEVAPLERQSALAMERRRSSTRRYRCRRSSTCAGLLVVLSVVSGPEQSETDVCPALAAVGTALAESFALHARI
jgi:hypothetical protein